MCRPLADQAPRACVRSPPQAAALVGRFDAVRFSWIPRERNRHADALANAAMDAAAGKPPAGDASARRAAGEAAADRRPAQAREAAPGRPDRRHRPGDRAGLLGAAADLHRHPADPGPARRDRVHRAAALLRAAATCRCPSAARPRPGPRPPGWPRWPRAVAAVVSSPAVPVYGHRRARSPGRSAACRSRVEDDLIECDFGDWEGRTFAEVRERGPARWTPGSPRPGSPRRAASRSPRSPSGCAGRWRRCSPAYPGRPWWWSRTSRRSSWCCATRSRPATPSCTGSSWTRPASRCWTCGPTAASPSARSTTPPTSPAR